MSIAVFLRQPTKSTQSDVFISSMPVEVVVNADPRPVGDMALVIWEFDENGMTTSNELIRVPGKIVSLGKSGAGFEPSTSFVWPTVATKDRTMTLEIFGHPGSFPIKLKADLKDLQDLGVSPGSVGLMYKLMVRLEQSRRVVAESPTWMLLRDFQNFANDGRPVVTFVLGPTATDNYYKGAELFWRAHSDLMVSAGSMAAVLRFLRGERDLGMGTTIQRGWTIGPWGQVNLVAHGFFAAWNVQMLEAEPSLFPGRAGETPWQDANDVADARKAKGKAGGKLVPPPKKMLDKNSTIAILGCLVGLEPRLTRELFLLFGGNAPLAGCKKLQVYSWTGTKATQHLRDVFFFLYSSPNGKAVDYWSAAKRAEAAKTFAHKYSEKGAPTDSQWGKWLAKKKDNFDDHVPSNEKMWFIVRVDYESFHAEALETISTLAKSMFSSREPLFVDDLWKNSVGNNQKAFGTFDKESKRQVVLKDAERTVVTDMIATEKSSDGSHVRFLVQAFFFMVIPHHDKAHDLNDADQFLWVIP